MKRSCFLKALFGIITIPFAAIKLLEGDNVVDPDIVTVKTPKGDMWFSREEQKDAEACRGSFYKVRYIGEPTPPPFPNTDEDGFACINMKDGRKFYYKPWPLLFQNEKT